MITRYKTINELLEDAFAKYSQETAYSCAGHALNYSEINELSLRFASYLRNELKLEPGDRIAIQLPNILQYPVAFYGAIRAGLVVVNTNPLYTAREVRYQLKDSGAKVLVVLSNVASAAASIIKDTDVKHVILTDFADLHPAPKKQIINFLVKYVKKMVPKFSFENSIKFGDVVAKPGITFTKPQVDPDTLMILQYTGGTTGVAKGAMLSQGNMASNVWQLINLLPLAFEEGKETFIACLPLYHIYALNLHMLSGFSRGEHNVLIPNPRDLDGFIKVLKTIQLTVFVGINTLFVALCRKKAMQDVDFSKMKVTCAGGMALTEDAARAWKDLTGHEVIEGYGLTETSPVACGNILGQNHPGTIGFPVKESEIKVIDNDGNTLPAGEVGELCIKGPHVMLGYWQKPEETANVMDDEGWFKTGDMAVIAEEGFVKIVDRKKDMILVSGFNVYPNEIEDVVSQHDKIVEAAAIGIKNDQCGEHVRLYVVASDPELSPEEIKSHCRENLTAYKCPREIEFRQELPKTNVGKILRRVLKEEAGQV